MADDRTKLTELDVNRVRLVEEVVVGSETPAELGLLVRDSSNILYISTGVSSPSDWTKVGAQV